MALLKHQISIIGCGWLGLPLAKFLIDKGYSVKGSTTSKVKLTTLTAHGIQPFLIELHENELLGDTFHFLSGSDTVILNIPPGLRSEPNKNHVSELMQLINPIEASGIKHVLHVSSTSVFNDALDFPVITSRTSPNATSKSAAQLIEIEDMLQNNSNFETTILRFGGLFDSERHPAKVLSGRKNVSNPNAPINLIHKNDCIGIIYAILKTKVWNVALNAVYPLHPDKKSYYTAYSKAHDLALPEFNTKEKSKGKIVASTKLVQLLNYSFKTAP